MKLTKKHTTKAFGALSVVSLAGVFGGVAEAETVGSLDVSVDTQALRDAIDQAASEGVTVFRDTTRVRVGNHAETGKARLEAEKYYADKVKEINQIVKDYRTKKAEYKAEVAKQNQLATDANHSLSGGISTLNALGRGVTTTSKVYSESEFNNARTKLNEAVAKTQAYKRTEISVANFNSLQNSMVSFQTQSDMGNIKLVSEEVVVNSADDVSNYERLIRAENERLATYVNSLANQSGTVPESDRPTFKNYRLKIADDLTQEYVTSVEVPVFTPVIVPEPEIPSASYAFYDIRQTGDVGVGLNNKDGEEIAVKQGTPNEHQAMVNQTIAIGATSDPLPAGRYDKYHQLAVTMELPEGVKVNEEITKALNRDWDMEIKGNKVIFRATDDYLLEINTKQAGRNGTISGIMQESFYYNIPKLYTKLLKDNAKYIFSSSVMINHEYKASSGSVIVRTDQADPEKHNTDDKGVVVDGKQVFPGFTNNYNLTWDFDQYKGVNIDREMQEKSLDLIDYYPSEALKFNPSKHTITVKDGDKVIAVGQADGSFKDADGQTVSGLTWSQIDSYKGIDRKGPAVKVSISGYDRPYYKEYVEKGKKLTVTIPMETLVVDSTPDTPGGVYGGNTYTNVFYQSDFGNIYKSNEVSNSVTVLDPRKDAVLSISRLESLDIKNNPTARIEQGTDFSYRTSGSNLALSVLGSSPSSYSMTDAFHEADEYNGSYLVESNGEIQFKEGTALYNKYRWNGGKLPKDTDVTKYTTQTIMRDVSGSGLNTLVGKVGKDADSRWTVVRVSFDQDFLEQIDHTKSTFQMDMFVKTKRIKNMDNVTNIFQEEINGMQFDSTEVVTNSKASSNDTLNGGLEGLRADVEKNKEDIKTLNSNLSVVRRDVTETKSLMDAFQTAQKALNAKYEAGIEANRRGVLSVRTLAERLQKEVGANVGQKLEQKNSELTIYVPTVKTDVDALLYATNHGIAPGSIKQIKLNKDNRYVVIYNSSKTAINGGPEATNKPLNVEKFAEANKGVTKPVETKKPEVKSETFTIKYSVMTKELQARIESVALKPYISQIKYGAGNVISEVVFNLNGKTQAEILDLLRLRK